MSDKMLLTDRQQLYLCKNIVWGVVIGLLVGFFINKIVFMFSLGGITGILYSLIKVIIEKIIKSK